MSLRQQLISPDEQISPEHLQFLICDLQLNCILSFEHLQALLSLDFIIYAVRSVCKYANGMYVACRLTDHWKALLVPAFFSAQNGIVCVCCFQNITVCPVTAANIREGMSTEDINTLVYDFTVAHGAIPAPLNYEGFPKSVCTSINEEVCHGIPDKNIILRSGDIINVDVSTIYNGYFSDASRMFMIGEVAEDRQKLVRVTKECLEKGIEAAQPWRFLGDVGAVIQEHAESNGYSVVREFCGHGVGLKFHEIPEVEHVG